MCKISVIIPSYNAELYIEECLDSIVNQSLSSFEIICVDDCSNDMTVPIIKGYVEKFSYVFLYEQKKQGPGVARNLGISKAKGEFICFMDADDYYPNYDVLKLLYDTAQKTGVLMCGGNILNKYGDRYEEDSTNFQNEGFVKSIDFPRFIGQTRFIYKKSFIIDNHIQYPSYVRFEDPPFVMESILMAGLYYTITDCVYVRRTGYKSVKTNLEIARGVIKGIERCIELASEFKLVDFYQRELMYALCDSIEYTSAYISDEIIMKDLRMIKDISRNLCGVVTIPFYDNESFKNYLRYIECTIKRCKRAKRIVVYGAGVTASRLLDSGYIDVDNICGIVTTNTTLERSFRGYKIKKIDEYINDTNNVSIIIATDEKYLPDIVANLKELGFNNYLSVTARIIFIAQSILHL